MVLRQNCALLCSWRKSSPFLQTMFPIHQCCEKQRCNAHTFLRRGLEAKATTQDSTRLSAVKCANHKEDMSLDAQATE